VHRQALLDRKQLLQRSHATSLQQSLTVTPRSKSVHSVSGDVQQWQQKSAEVWRIEQHQSVLQCFESSLQYSLSPFTTHSQQQLCGLTTKPYTDVQPTVLQCKSSMSSTRSPLRQRFSSTSCTRTVPAIDHGSFRQIKNSKQLHKLQQRCRAQQHVDNIHVHDGRANTTYW
jgi:hypothetical protein